MGVYAGRLSATAERPRPVLDNVDVIAAKRAGDMRGHIIVSGDDALATTIVEELNNAGVHIVKLTRPTELATAGIARARAVICAGDDDAINLEIALLARKANPDVRVVARLANDVLRTAMAADKRPGAILDVADLAAPSVVEACLAHTVHPFEAAGIEFVVSGAEAPRDATLREIYGDLSVWSVGAFMVELRHPGQGGAMSGPGPAGARRRLDRDDRHRRRVGRPRHQGPAADRKALTSAPTEASARCRTRPA